MGVTKIQDFENMVLRKMFKRQEIAGE